MCTLILITIKKHIPVQCKLPKSQCPSAPQLTTDPPKEELPALVYTDRQVNSKVHPYRVQLYMKGLAPPTV